MAPTSPSTKATLPPKRLEKTSGCCASFWAELNPFQPWFLVMDSSGYKIDVPESFAPSDLRTVLGKIITTGFALASLIVGLLKTPSLAFFFAYFTNVSLVIMIAYLLMSFISSVSPLQIRQPGEKITGLPKMTWIFFVTGVHAQFMAALLWWVTVYDHGTTPINFYNVSSHGGAMFLALIDGLVLNRIPLRLMHWWGFILPVDVLYLIWTILHYVLSIGNPNEMDEDVATNDDAIYSVLAWGSDERSSSTLLSVGVIFVLGPLIYLYMWCMGRFPFGCCTWMTRLYYLDRNNRTARGRRETATLPAQEVAGRYRLYTARGRKETPAAAAAVAMAMAEDADVENGGRYRLW